MPFIEDDNGLAIYFSREQWKHIYWGLADQASWAWAEVDSPEYDILVAIANRIGYGD